MDKHNTIESEGSTMFEKLTSGIGLFITIILAVVSLHIHLLAKERMSWENEAEHRAFNVRFGIIESKMWTVDNMKSLYSSPEYWTNHIQDGATYRKNIVDDIAEDNFQN